MATVYIWPGATYNGDGSAPTAAAGAGQAGAKNTWSGLTWTAGNTYLQKRGTTYSAAVSVASGTDATRSNKITVGAYYNSDGTDDTSQPKPIITCATDNGMSVGFKQWIVLRDLDIRSTYADNWVAALSVGASQDCTFTRLDITGHDYAVWLGSDSYDGSERGQARNTFTDCNFVQTGGNGAGYSAVYMETGNQTVNQGSYGVKDLTFLNCTFTGYQAVCGHSGGTNGRDSSIRNILFKNCTAVGPGNGWYFSPYTGAAKNWTVPVAANTDAWCYNLMFDSCTATNCSNAGFSITSIGGYIKNCIARGTNSIGPYASTTGGIQVICKNYLVCDNISYDTYTTSNWDGVGIFLDVSSDFTDGRIGCENVICVRNICYNNLGNTGNNTLAEYQSNFTPDYVSSAASGIRIYNSHDCVIASNICYNNGNGIGIEGFSYNLTIVNNTLVDNFADAIHQAWTMPNDGNVIKNNILKNSYAGVWVGSWHDKSTTGNITLTSSAVGQATCTSTATDFTTHNVNYGIREVGGSGFAYIYEQVSNSVVKVTIWKAFSGTSFTNGNWKLTLGSDTDATYTNNLFHNNTFDRKASNSGTAITQKSSDISADPKLDTAYRPDSTSPVLKQGSFTTIAPRLDYYGKPYWKPGPIGAVEVVKQRTKKKDRQ